MNIVVFGDVHGQLLLLFHLAARWQQEHGQQLDLMLQVGDLGVFPDVTRLDRSTRRRSAAFPAGLGFRQHFVASDPTVAALVNETRCPLLFVRGNHEDHAWLDRLEHQTSASAFPVDVYQRVYCLKTGMPYRFTQGDETITIVGIGRIGRPAEARKDRAHFLQPEEQQRLEQLETRPIDVLLTHDAARGQIYPGSGSAEIEAIRKRLCPTYHLFGHYGGPCRYERVTSSGTESYKLADLHPDYSTPEQALRAGALGWLAWHRRDEHHFTIGCQESSP